PMFEGWWPVWAKKEAFETPEIFAGGRQINVLARDSQSMLIKISMGDPGNLIVPIFYYPHWRATVNDAAVAVSRNENGVISIPIAGETTTVRLHFEEPLRNVLAAWISLTIWLGLILVVGLHYRRESLALITRRPMLEQQFENG